MDKEKADEDRRRRRREREAARARSGAKDDGKSKDGKSRSTRKAQGLDVIDKLDLTGIYGQGCKYRCTYDSAI